jgi:hypothetical protein
LFGHERIDVITGKLSPHLLPVFQGSMADRQNLSGSNTKSKERPKNAGATP